LLANLEVSYNEELKNLELMKCRFGDASLHACDVMLRDIAESDRLRRQFLERRRPQGQEMLAAEKLKVHVVSKHFWQQVLTEMEADNSFKMRESLSRSFKEFHSMYKQVKPNRELKFMNNLGVVRLTLHFDNEVKAQFSVSPLQAAIITLFHDSDPNRPPKSLSLDYIKDKLQITAERVRQQCAYWVTNGVLKELQVQKNLSETEIVYLASKTLERDATQNHTGPVLGAKKVADEPMDPSDLEEQRLHHAHDAIIRVLKENVNGCSAKQIWHVLRFTAHKSVITSEQKMKEILDGLPGVKAGKEQPTVYRIN
jgi:hypothetical protein